MRTLCQCAHISIKKMLLNTKLIPFLSHLLLPERSETLSKTKSELKYVLWRPADVLTSGPIKKLETTLQRWLDL